MVNGRAKLAWCVWILMAWGLPAAAQQNHVLDLDGKGSYIELPSDIFTNLTEGTVEAWVKWRSPERYQRFFAFGEFVNDMGVGRVDNGQPFTLESFVNSNRDLGALAVGGLVRLQEWCHVAAVSGPGGMGLYFNGVLVGSNQYPKSFSAISGKQNFLGRWNAAQGGFDPVTFNGQIDEFRIWKIARTESQIRENMFKRLTGQEEGLVGLWNFDDPAQPGKDASPNGLDGKLMGNPRVVETQWPTAAGVIRPKLLTGRITDETGRPVPDAQVQLAQGGSELVGTSAGSDGSYSLAVRPNGQPYDIQASEGDKAAWRLGVPVVRGERTELNFSLRDRAVHGTVFSLDTNAPLAGVVVQVLKTGPEPVAVAGTTTDDKGKFKFTPLWPGTYRLRCHGFGGFIEHTNLLVVNADGPDPRVDLDFHIAPFKKGTWRRFGLQDGLNSLSIRDIHVAPDGVMWLATGGGVARFDGQEFTHLTKQDGLAGNSVNCIHRDPDGVMWFGTDAGLSRYAEQNAGAKFTNYTTADGLVANSVTALCRDPSGRLWVGMVGGVSRRDGTNWTRFAYASGFPIRYVRAIVAQTNGTVWVCGQGSLARIDGTNITRFGRADGLALDVTLSILRDADETMWFGGIGGVVHYDGRTFSTLTAKDGLELTLIWSIYREPDGTYWFGGESAGGAVGRSAGEVVRYDGKSFVTFTKEDGVTGQYSAMASTADGAMWFGGEQGGLVRYDPHTFAVFGARDGLASEILKAQSAADGTLWVATQGHGFSHFDGQVLTTLRREPISSLHFHQRIAR